MKLEIDIELVLVLTMDVTFSHLHYITCGTHLSSIEECDIIEYLGILILILNY